MTKNRGSYYSGYGKQNTLNNLLSKIQQTSDDPKELSKLEADVDEELKISDDLMFRTLHLRQKYISDECKKSNNWTLTVKIVQISKLYYPE